ncbi:MAG: AAA family ATPase [Magnetococcales bacterium]|nr:AAA family ATPase [Magnetococcales bacterium]
MDTSFDGANYGYRYIIEEGENYRKLIIKIVGAIGEGIEILSKNPGEIASLKKVADKNPVEGEVNPNVLAFVDAGNKKSNKDFNIKAGNLGFHTSISSLTSKEKKSLSGGYVDVPMEVGLRFAITPETKSTDEKAEALPLLTVWFLKLIETSDQSGGTQLSMELADPLALPTPRDYSDIDFIANPWFSNERKSGSQGHVHDEFKLAIGAPYAKFWPRYVAKSKKWTIHTPPLILPDKESLQEWQCQWAAFCVALASIRIILECSYRNKTNKSLEESQFFRHDSYIPKRPIDLKPNEVMESLKNKGITLPWYVLEAACSSLNAKKNVIFTGPPGCGKTELAMCLAKEAGYATPVAVTASPVWTTNELIGRYMPSMGDSKLGMLTFRPGFFLSAIQKGTWLIIDELNRADIDACFGELFTVLSGQPSILPFEERVADEERESGSEEDVTYVVKPIIILPQGGAASSEYSDYQVYPVDNTFRIIGTMNDADASRLHQLSYAFQRRFNIIRVEAPGPDIVQEIIERAVKHASKMIKDSNTRHFFKDTEGKLEESAIACLNALFAVSKKGSDLVQMRVVGIAQVKDIIDLLFEGISCSEPDKLLKLWKGKKMDEEIIRHIVFSYTAIGVVMSVFPQLTAFTGPSEQETLVSALKIIQSVFSKDTFYRITENDNEAFYRVINSDNQSESSDKDIFSAFLRIELERLLKPTFVNLSSLLGENGSDGP